MPIRFNQTELYVYNAMHKANDLSTDRSIGRLITIIEYFFVFFLIFKHFLSLSLSFSKAHEKQIYMKLLVESSCKANQLIRSFLFAMGASKEEEVVRGRRNMKVQHTFYTF